VIQGSAVPLRSHTDMFSAHGDRSHAIDPTTETSKMKKKLRAPCGFISSAVSF
jgi:hypothetical protein